MANSLLFCRINEAARHWQASGFPSCDGGGQLGLIHAVMGRASSRHKQPTLWAGLSCGLGSPRPPQNTGPSTRLLRPWHPWGPGDLTARRQLIHLGISLKGLQASGELICNFALWYFHALYSFPKRFSLTQSYPRDTFSMMVE